MDKSEIACETKIANEFNKFFINIGPKLAQKIPQPLKPFQSYMNRVNSEMENKTITVTEFKEAFYSLQSAGYGDISCVLSKIVSGSCVTHYYIHLTYHLQMEYFQTA